MSSPKVSVCIMCYSRKSELDITLPLWLAQTGIDYEIVIANGSLITLPKDNRIVSVPIDGNKLCMAYNKMFRQAKGEFVLMAQCDMQVSDPFQVKKMADMADYNTMVTEKFYKEGKRDCGLYCQFLMVSRERLLEVGGYDEEFDNGYAFEDSDLVVRLLKLGMNFKHLSQPPELGVYHIHHWKPMLDSPEIAPKLKRNKEFYWTKHKEPVMALYVKQFTRQLMMKRSEEEQLKGNTQCHK